MIKVEIKLALAKVHKYAVSESGDTIEVTERPKGGLSLILADGQGSGRSAKQNSNRVVAKTIAMISEGARDGAVARAVHDMFYAIHGGKVSAELLIVSADTATDTLVISRNTACPVFAYRLGEVSTLSGAGEPIGVRTIMKPLIDILPLEQVTTVVGFSDGIWHAGRYSGKPWQEGELSQIVKQKAQNPERLVEAILAEAMTRDQNRPRDDMAVFAFAVLPHQNVTKVRRLSASLPI